MHGLNVTACEADDKYTKKSPKCLVNPGQGKGLCEDDPLFHVYVYSVNEVSRQRDSEAKEKEGLIYVHACTTNSN